MIGSDTKLDVLDSVGQHLMPCHQEVNVGETTVLLDQAVMHLPTEPRQ